MIGELNSMKILSNSRIEVEGITYTIIRDIEKYVKHLKDISSPIHSLSNREFIKVDTNISIGKPVEGKKLNIVAKGGYLDITNMSRVHPAAIKYAKKLSTL